MTSNNHPTQPDMVTTPAPMRHLLPSTLPGAATYLILAIWVGLKETRDRAAAAEDSQATPGDPAPR